MGRKKKWKECVKSRTTTINGRAVKVPSLLYPAKVEEVVDANGKKVVHVTMKDRYAELHDFLKEVEDSLNGCNSDTEKEAIYRKYSAEADAHLKESLDISRRYEEKPSPDRSYIDALKQKNYYRDINPRFN